MRGRHMWLSGLGLGAAAAFLFDPSSGNKRRQQVRDVAGSVRDAAAKTARVVRTAADSLRTVRNGHGHHDESPPSDAVLADRVRAALGRTLSDPGAIGVSVDNGRVMLSGQVLAREESELMRAMWTVRGLRGVTAELETFDEPCAVLSLPG